MYISCDVESDGPCPGMTDYSMVSFGAFVVEPTLSRGYYSKVLEPISDNWIPEALAISGISREEMDRDGFDPKIAMERFANWLEEQKQDLKDDRLIFIADNNGFDWQFINWYFHHFIGRNPFGFSSQNINSLYKGFVNNPFKSFKHLRKTSHNHNPMMDAKGNAEALLEMQKMGLRFKF